jgi:hypothetical protein
MRVDRPTAARRVAVVVTVSPIGGQGHIVGTIDLTAEYRWPRPMLYAARARL